MSASDWVTLEVQEIMAETDKALLLLLEDDRQKWVPLSQIADSDDYKKGDTNLELSVTKWFADKEDLP